MCFSIDARVSWRQPPDDTAIAHPHEVARCAREAIAKAARNCDVLRPDAAQQEIAAELRSLIHSSDIGFEILDVQTQVNVDAATRDVALGTEQLRQQHRRDEVLHAELLRAEHQREIDRLNREFELDELARRQVRARMTFLHAEILDNPSAATLYSLLLQPGEYLSRISGPDSGKHLVHLADQVDQWSSENQWVSVARILHDFLADLPMESRRELLTLLKDTVKAFGNEVVAQRLIDLAD